MSSAFGRHFFLDIIINYYDDHDDHDNDYDYGNHYDYDNHYGNYYDDEDYDERLKLIQSFGSNLLSVLFLENLLKLVS